MPIRTRPAERAVLVCALLADTLANLDLARQRLAERLGPLGPQAPVYSFAYTDYYRPELGEGLVKQLVAFRDTVDPASLAQTKRLTMRLEEELGRWEGGKCLRRVNLDPGLVTLESLVLATTKYAGHRVCIAPDLYAEVTLLFEKGEYRPLPWTYPDYRGSEVQSFLQGIRTGLLATRRPGG